jgi:uncharacterized protein YjbI with pentapeptide repeats
MVAPNESMPTEDKGIDFRDRDLRGCDFSDQDLCNADFSGADLRGCNFWGSDLSGADFRSAKLGVDQEQIYSLLLAGFISALGYWLLLGILMEIINWLEGGSHNADAAITDLPNLNGCDHNEVKKSDIWVILKRSDVTNCFLVALPCGLATIFMVGIQLLGYVTQDSILEANVITVGALAAAIFCGHQAVHNAHDTLTTNFSTTNLSATRFDRAVFQQAKLIGAQINQVEWL